MDANDAELDAKLRHRAELMEHGVSTIVDPNLSRVTPTISTQSTPELADKLRDRLRVLGEEETAPQEGDGVRNVPFTPSPNPSPAKAVASPVSFKPSPKSSASAASKPAPSPPSVPSTRPMLNAQRAGTPTTSPKPPGAQAPLPQTSPARSPSSPLKQNPQVAARSPSSPAFAGSSNNNKPPLTPTSRAVSCCAFYVLPLSLLSVVYLVLTLRSAYHFFLYLPGLPDEAIYPAPGPLPESQFAPAGLRLAAATASALQASLRSTRTHRASVGRDGQLYSCAAPAFALQDVASAAHRVDSAVLDDSGLLLYAPQAGDASLVALDAKTMLPRWALALQEGEVPAGGHLLLLNHDESRSTQVVYHATRHRAYASRAADGQNVWGPVPTGLSDKAGGGMQGLTYHASTDSLVGLALDGSLFVLSRKTGQQVAEPKRLPCAPPSGAVGGSGHVDAGACVLHAMAASPASGRLFVVATARDDQDGAVDGFADRAALYIFDLVPGEADSSLPLRLRVTSQLVLGSSAHDVGPPAVSPDGKLVLLGDQFGRLTAFNTESLAPAWSVGDLGSGLVHVALASDEKGLAVYVTTDSTVCKLVDVKDDGSQPPVVAWKVDRMFVGAGGRLAFKPATAPVVVANGLVVGVHAETTAKTMFQGLVIKSGVALLDRATGAMRSFAFGREAMGGDVVVGADGSMWTMNRPERRQPAADLLSYVSALPPLVQGVTRFKPASALDLTKDAICAAAARIDNTLRSGASGWLKSAPAGAEEAMREDAWQVAILVAQASQAMNLALQEDRQQVPGALALQPAWDAVAALFAGGLVSHAVAQAALQHAQPHAVLACKVLREAAGGAGE